MRKRFLLAFCLPLCLSACGDGVTLLGGDYRPQEGLPCVLRNGDAFASGEEGYDVLISGRSVAEEIKGAEMTGETLLFYFHSDSCSHCLTVKEGFASFLEQTDIKVLAYTDQTSPTFREASKEFASFSSSAVPFFAKLGTPFFFSYHDGEFSKIELMGNHKTSRTVAKLMEKLYSYPYLYELTSYSSLSSFRSKGYPVLLLEEGGSFPEAVWENARTSQKPFGFIGKAKLSAEEKETIESAYGDSSFLIIGKEAYEEGDWEEEINRYYSS